MHGTLWATMSRSFFVRRAQGRLRPGLVASLLLGAPLALGGCPDSEAKFNEFLDNTKDDRDFMPPPPPDVMPSAADISGTFLLAVSTIILPDLPLQFVVTNTMTTDDMGNVTLKACLQPLSLDQGKVNVPRMPVGEELCYMDVPIVEGRFDIDAGVVEVVGEANPITGSPIVASLKMVGTVIDENFYCGSIEGEVMMPIMNSLAGSTFAAVRLEDPAVLPPDVTKNCAGDTVRDM